MNDACRAFRIEWLSAEGTALEHASRCEACTRWVRSTEGQRAALSSLARLAAPAELEERLVLELAGVRSHRLERVLGSLVRLGAPSTLDERVAAELAHAGAGDEERGRSQAQAVRALEVQPAPDVLERLVNEELGDPARHRAERFPGSLERQHAPAVLAHRLSVSVRRRALVRLVLGPLATLAAAGMVVWFAVGHVGESPRRPFRVIEASSLDDLDPMARALAESLGGGVRR